MQRIVEKKELMERVHLLIKRSATGTPDALAKRLEVSKSTVFRIIETMRGLNAPIVYDFGRQTYEYEYPVDFFFGFINKANLQEIDGSEVNGGFGVLNRLNFF